MSRSCTSGGAGGRIFGFLTSHSMHIKSFFMPFVILQIAIDRFHMACPDCSSVIPDCLSTREHVTRGEFIISFAFDELSQFRELVVDILIQMRQLLVEASNSFGACQDIKS
jgi:hypothetical protein